jgi:hypothetical protein
MAKAGIMKKIFILLASVSLLEISTLAQSGGAGGGAAGAGSAGTGTGTGTAGAGGTATGATGNSSAGVGTANSGVSTTGASVGFGNAASSPGSPGANALQVTPAQAQPQVGLGTQSGAVTQGPVAISGGMSEASGAAINRSASAGGNAAPAGTPPEPLEVSTGTLSEVPGVITLRGVVRGESEKWEIERQVRKLKGVLTVNNLLQIADKEDPRGARQPRKGETTIRYEGLPGGAR